MASNGEHKGRPKYTFEEAWRFLNRYGLVYIQFDDESLIEVRTGVTKTEEGIKNIIRFFRKDEEILRVFNRCWDENLNCETEIDKYRVALMNYIDTAYIE